VEVVDVKLKREQIIFRFDELKLRTISKCISALTIEDGVFGDAMNMIKIAHAKEEVEDHKAHKDQRCNQRAGRQEKVVAVVVESCGYLKNAILLQKLHYGRSVGFKVLAKLLLLVRAESISF